MNRPEGLEDTPDSHGKTQDLDPRGIKSGNKDASRPHPRRRRAPRTPSWRRWSRRGPTCRRAAFAEGAGATAAVRDECGLEASLPEMVRAAASDVELVSGPASGARTLTLAIAEVHAPGGGPFSGPKSMTVEATLREGGKVVATARSHRVTAEPFGGTCGQLQKVARAIASDLAAWLANPASDAALGDAR